MIAALQPLSEHPGVDLVMLASRDGVPIAVKSRADGHSSADPIAVEDPSVSARNEPLAALAAGWMSDLREAASLLSSEEPRRAVLRAGRGTLVVQRTSSALLIVLLARGMDPEDVRLAVDGTIARMERGRRGSTREVARESGRVAVVDPVLPKEAHLPSAEAQPPLPSAASANGELRLQDRKSIIERR